MSSNHSSSSSKKSKKSSSRTSAVQQTEASGSKRKWATVVDDADNSGPFLVTLPSVVLPAEASFHAYEPADKTSGSNKAMRQARVLVAETPSIVYAADTLAQQQQQQGNPLHCQYVVGLLDSESGELRLKEVPIMSVTRHIKGAQDRTAVVVDKSKYLQSKNALGETFGTKKIKTQIRAIEKNRINSGALGDASSTIQESVDSVAANMPTAEQMAHDVLADQPLPPYNTETKVVADIYPINKLILHSELSALEPVVTAIAALTNPNLLTDMLGQNIEPYVFRHLSTVLTSEKRSQKTPHIQKLVYIHFLLALYNMTQSRKLKPETLSTTIPGMPAALALDLLRKFCGRIDTGAGLHHYIIDKQHKARVLNWVLVLALHLEQFQVDVNQIATELKLQHNKMAQYFRALGCKVEPVGASETSGLSAIESGAGSRVKMVAMLHAPLSLPAPVRRVVRNRK
ncbi:DNA-directed RNA polymerase I subunit rpa49 [Sorochytrium milnesiophthora]